MDLEVILKKTAFNIIVYGIYYNLVFYLLKPVIFKDFFYLSYILILYASGIIDTYLRPLETEKHEEENYSKYIGLLFLANPVLFTLAIMENEWIFGERINLISWLGLGVYLTAAIIVLVSRIQLGKQATGTLVLLDDHQLIDTGLYAYVRHPMYFGSLLGVLGFWLIAQAVFIPLVSFILYIWVFLRRIKYEEMLLEDQFGQAYKDYEQRTWRLVPFIL